MAGYRRQNTVYNLTFPDYEGLTVTIRGLTTGQMMQLWDDTASAKAAKEAGQTETASKSTRDMLTMFANALIEWNLEDESGVPVPTSMAGIESQDLPFVLSLVEAWTSVLAGTNEDLGKDSDSGKQSLEALIPMETS